MDETDSGLDIDALRIVADGVNKLRREDRSFLVITHYQRLLDYIVPDIVHVLMDGRIVKTGDKNLALELEEKGYGWDSIFQPHGFSETFAEMGVGNKKMISMRRTACERLLKYIDKKGLKADFTTRRS